MAKRRGLFRRLLDTVREVFREQPTPKRKATKEETRQFRRGKESSARAAEQYAKDRRDAEATRQAQANRRARERRARERRARAADPYRRIWRSEGNRTYKDYDSHYRLFESLPGVDDLDDDEKERLWYSYVRYMVTGRGYQFNSIEDNPFWSELGIDPGDFRWGEWRSAMGYSSRR